MVSKPVKRAQAPDKVSSGSDTTESKGTSTPQSGTDDASVLQTRLKDEFKPLKKRRANDRAGASAIPKKPETAVKKRKEDIANDLSAKNAAKNRESKAEHAFKKGHTDKQIDEDETQTDLKTVLPQRNWHINAKRGRQILKSLIALLLIVAAGWVPAMRLFQVSSVEAVVNARVVTLRTPIDGIIQFQTDVNALDDDIAANSVIAKIINQRIDKSRSNELRKDLDLAVIQQNLFQARQVDLQKRQDELVLQTQSFRSERTKILKTFLDEASSEKAEVLAKLELAKEQRDNSQRLLDKKVITVSAHREKQIEVDVLTATLERVAAQIERTRFEYNTLRDGGYIGDHYNDRSRSEVELEAIQLRAQDVQSDLMAQKQRVAALQTLLKAENTNVDQREFASIVLPVPGRIWEPLVTNGEYVNQGQPLVRVLDCMNAVVTTAVSEEVYNNLLVGSQATFILRESGQEFAAVITQLSGVSSKSENLAILPSSLEKEPYRATVRVPDIGSGGACLLGKTGRVVFSDQS